MTKTFRVGDVVRIHGRPRLTTIIAVDGDGVTGGVTVSDGQRYDDRQVCDTHADGTAIEPARVACSECHQPIGEAAFTSVGVPGKQCSEECHFCAAYMRGLEELRVIAGEATFAAAPAGEAAKAPAAHAEPYTLVFGDAGGWRRSVDTPTIARALFETDANVMAHVNRRSESDVSERRASIMQRCWDRGFAGESPEWRWYVRAVDRAKLMGGVK